MARGFESKSVEAQQEEAARRRSTPRKPEMTPQARMAEEQKRALELTRTRARHDLSRAVAPAHRQMLEDAIAALDSQIAEINARS
jgi:TATA-binding protein-associated factor Taf7